MDDKDDDNPLSMRVAVVVAILATFMGICKVKDDNINQAMQQRRPTKLTTGPSTKPATSAKKSPTRPSCNSS